MSAEDEFHKNGKLVKFFKNEAAVKRIKSLGAFTTGSSAQEVWKFYNTYSSDVYKLVLDVNQQLNYNASKGETVFQEDIDAMIVVLTRLLTDVSDKIRKRWQVRSLGNTISQMLAYENAYKVRAAGLKLLLKLMDIIGATKEKDQHLIDTFAFAVPFLPFASKNSDLVAFYDSTPLSGSTHMQFAKTNSRGSVLDSLKLLDIMLNFILATKEQKHFQTWFDLMKTRVLPVLYPMTCRTLELIPKDEKVPGFQPDCPHEIQELLVRWLCKCLRTDEYISILLQDDIHIKLVFELFRQTFTLPVSYFEATKQVILCYRDWVENKHVTAFFNENIQICLQTMISQVSAVFYFEPSQFPHTARETPHKIKICREVLDLLNYIASEPTVTLSAGTWERLIVTLLNASNYMIKTGELGGLTPESVAYYDLQVFTPLIDCLFQCYIRSGQRTRLWEVLREKMGSWFGCKPCITQWKKTLLTLTEDMLHTLALETKTYAEQCADIEDSTIGVDELAETRQFDEKFRIWDHFLRIIGDPAQIQLIPVRESVLDGIVASLNLFINAVQKPAPTLSKLDKIKAAKGELPGLRQLPERHYLPQGNTLVKIFGPILFDTCLSPHPQLIHGRAIAFGALCSIFTTRCAEPFDELYLSKFVQCLHVGLYLDEEAEEISAVRSLTSGEFSLTHFLRTHQPREMPNVLEDPDEKLEEFKLDSKEAIRWTIVNNCKQLFGMNLPGVSVLIPDFLRVIEHELSPERSKTTPRGIRLACINIVGSLIGATYSLNNEVLPDLRGVESLQALKIRLDDEEKALELKLKEQHLIDQQQRQSGVKMMANPVYGYHSSKIGKGFEGIQDSERRPTVLPELSAEFGTYQDLRTRLVDILLNCINPSQHADPNIMMRCVWIVTTTLYMEIEQARCKDKVNISNNSLVSRAVDLILACGGHFAVQNSLLSQTAFEAVKVLAFIQNDLGHELSARILVGLAEHAEHHISNIVQSPKDRLTDVRGKMAAEALYLIRDWIMLSSDPNALLTSNSIISRVIFDAYEKGVTCIQSLRSGDMSRSRTFTSHTRVSSFLDDNLTLSNTVKELFGVGGRPEEKSARKESSVSMAKEPPPPPYVLACASIQEAADSCLRHMFNHMNHFPLPGGLGPAQLCSTVSEEDDANFCDGSTAARRINLVWNGTVLLTLLERETDHEDTGLLPVGQRGAVCRIIARDKTGKYCWDFSEVAEDKVFETIRANSPEEKQPASSPEPSAAEPQDVELKFSGEFKEEHDLLWQVRQYIQQTFADKELIPTHKDSSTTDPALAEKVGQLKDRIQSLQNQEHMLRDKQVTSREETRRQLLEQVRTSSEKQILQRQNVTFMDHVRSILAHLYIGLDAPVFYLPHALATQRLLVLEDSDRFRRSVKLLDSTPGRECHKIGVIYVKAGQENQRDILHNEESDTSEAYRRFIENLGEKVDITKHNGFVGGLDHRSTGRYSTYYANATLEIMYHVVTMMPTKDNDAQQISKKRQVGNDHVHIVWSDHHRDYRPSTISSQFNDAHIIIYPLKAQGMYRIQVHFKASKVPPFGPLQDGMVIPEVLLAPLVRLTALNANRARRYSTQGYGRPYPTRQKYINDIIERHSQSLKAHELVAQFFPLEEEEDKAEEGTS